MPLQDLKKVENHYEIGLDSQLNPSRAEYEIMPENKNTYIFE